MIFPFRVYDTRIPIPSLGGITVRHKPVIPLHVFGPTGMMSVPVLVDSGSDDVILPLVMAKTIGVDLTNAPILQFQSLGGPTIRVRFASVLLQLVANLQQIVRWRAVVGFGVVNVGGQQWGLLGIAGGLQYFSVWPDIANNQLHFDPLPTLPATTATVP